MATKEDVINYVMNTPGNSNRTVLSSLLEDLSGNSNDNSVIFYRSYESDIIKSNKSYSEVIDMLDKKITFYLAFLDDNTGELELIASTTTWSKSYKSAGELDIPFYFYETYLYGEIPRIAKISCNLVSFTENWLDITDDSIIYENSNQ